MKKRIFIAINLPDYLKKKIIEIQKKWKNLPFRWTKEANLHITLVFIGLVSDEQMLEVCRIAREIADKHEPFEINLKRVCYGPPGKPIRMIWIEGETSSELTKLRNDLEQALLSADTGFNHQEKRPFKPHITLGRLKLGHRPSEFMGINVEEEISWSFPVETIEVMESDLKRDGADYTILESTTLKL